MIYPTLRLISCLKIASRNQRLHIAQFIEFRDIGERKAKVEKGSGGVAYPNPADNSISPKTG
jgi:hypothetical protein